MLFSFIQYRYSSQNCSAAARANGLYLKITSNRNEVQPLSELDFACNPLHVALIFDGQKTKKPRSNLLLRGDVKRRLYNLSLQN
ncbi:hypothetical protein EF707_14220 [Vibrio fluvialis]|nr:hypothetical protein [Vibrio fluvialis]